MKIQRSTKKKRFLASAMIFTLVLQLLVIQLPAKRAEAATFTRIKSVWHQNYLYEEDGQVRYGDIHVEDYKSHWEIINVGDGSVRIRNRESGNYMNIEQLTGNVQSTTINMDWYSARWYIENADKNQKRIRNSWQGSSYIHIENLNGSAQYGTINHDWLSGKWLFEEVTTQDQPPLGEPDLIITDLIWFPQNPQAGDEVTFSAIVKNQGNGVSSNNVISGVGFKVNGELVSWSDNYNIPIEPGQSVVLTSNGGPSNKATWTAINGNFVINGWVDDVDRISESNEDNNIFDKVLVIGSLPSPTPTSKPTLPPEEPTPTPKPTLPPEEPTPTPKPIPTPIPASVGASVPYTRYEAESGIRGGSAELREALDFDVLKTASEASNQRYVALKNNGDHVEWTVNQQADGITMRFTMPDSADGMGLRGSLDAYVNGQKVKTIELSSYWSWQYFVGDTPQDTPGGQPRFRFDEVHFLLDDSLKPGDKFRIQKTNGDSLEYGVDFVEIEPVPAAIQKPANALSVVDFGASPNDDTDDLPAFLACVEAADAAGKDVYIPEGRFVLDGIWRIGASNIKITGAGIWYTEIHFPSSQPSGGGISGDDSCSNLEFCHVYLSSMLRSRWNQHAIYKCFMDTYGSDSYIHDFWLEHFECGFWIGDYDLPIVTTDNLVIANGRIRNNLADGVNFCQGTKNSTVQNCSIRNNGDDGLAVWPDNTMGAPMGINNTFKYNTIENNWRAGSIAIFGGDGHKIHNNYIKDGFKGSAIRLNTTFPGYHFENTTSIRFYDNVMINCGTSNCCYGGERGAIDLEASSSGIKNIFFDNNEIINAQRDAIQIGYGGGFSNIVFNNTTINGTGKDPIRTSRFSQPHDGTAIFVYNSNGEATFNNLFLSDIEDPELYLVQTGFNLTLNNVVYDGNSGPSPTPTPEPTPNPTPTPEEPTPIPEEPSQEVDKIVASSHEWNYIAENAIDGDLTTYWEGAGGTYPNTLTLNLGADYNVSSIDIKLNPDMIWSSRTQNIQVLGHNQDSDSFINLVSAKDYTFDPITGNMVAIPVNAKVSKIQLLIRSNTGASGAQVAELIVNGTAAPNPDLTITGIDFLPKLPNETDNIKLLAQVKNIGTAMAKASNVKFYIDNSFVGLVDVPGLDVGEITTIDIDIGLLNAGRYKISAIVDEENKLIELDKSNNTYTNEKVEVSQVESSDLIATINWSPSNPSAGDRVTFTVNLKNQGNIPSADSHHNVNMVLKDSLGNTIKTLSGSYKGVLNPNVSETISMGTWVAVDGNYLITCTVDEDIYEKEVKRDNNVITSSLYSGRGANMPFTVIEAEDPANSTNGTVLAKNYTPGDFAGEASGRSAVYLDSVGEYVEFTLTSAANAFVLRNAVAEDTSGTISLYINGEQKSKFKVSSKFSYLYATPQTLGRLGYDNSGSKAYWLYEDAQLLLDEVYPAGSKIRIQKDSGDVPWIYVDMIETENVAPPISNPDPSKYVEVSASKSIEEALNDFRQDSSKKGIFIPAGEWEISNKIFLYGRAVEIIGAGPWHTRLVAPKNSTNTDVGFNISSAANGSIIKDISAWGNFVNRVDGPGKFIDGNNMQNVTVDNVWVEHFVCLYWGVNASYNTFKNCRIKNVFADGINMTNGSSYNLISNCYARACGDDAFALFSAIDSGGSYNVGNVYSNLTAVCNRRAASFAVYGGSDNIYKNLYGADTLTYPGITISSYSFNYNTLGFGDVDCVFDGVTLDRCGGDFWTSQDADDKINDYQNFGAIWIYAGDRDMKNIIVKNVDINDPVYFGIQFQTMHPSPVYMKNIRLENININNAPRYGIKLVVKAEKDQGPCVGEASFTNVKINNAKIMPVYGIEKCPNFTINKSGSNNW